MYRTRVEAAEPLRVEHRALLARFTHLLFAVDRAIDLGGLHAAAASDELYDFLVHRLEPCARAEEEVLYPAVDRIVGTGSASAILRRQHLAIAGYTRCLERLRSRLTGAELSRGQQRELRRTLYGLQALVQLHLAVEEELYLPALDRALDEVNADALFDQMNIVAARVAAGRRTPSAGRTRSAAGLDQVIRDEGGRPPRTHRSRDGQSPVPVAAE